VALQEVPGAWGRDTATAIAAASLEAPAALAERLLRRLAREAGAEPILLITGGDAEQLQARIEAPARHVPDLVLQGLALVPDA
jgi:type III pantothenate kinase